MSLIDDSGNRFQFDLESVIILLNSTLDLLKILIFLT